MADSSARRIEYEPHKRNGSKKHQRVILDPHKVPYSGLEKKLYCSWEALLPWV